MLFVEGDAVGFVGGEAWVGARDEGAADGDLGGEADDGGGDGGGGERVDGRVDVAGVGGQERAEDEEDFARAVGGGVAGRSWHWGLVMGAVRGGGRYRGWGGGGCVQESGARHVECVLQAGVAFGVLGTEGLEGTDVVVGVAAHVADADGEAVAHADDAELGDGVLLEELGDEFLGVAKGEQVAGGQEVFLQHGGGEVDDEDEVADDASLEWCGVFQQSARRHVSV